MGLRERIKARKWKKLAHEAIDAGYIDEWMVPPELRKSDSCRQRNQRKEKG